MSVTTAVCTARGLHSGRALDVFSPHMDPGTLRDIFLTESEDLLADFEQGLLTLEARPEDKDAIHRIFRSAHTLKSNAGMVGVEAMLQLAHVAESVLARVRDQSLAIDQRLVTILLRSVDRFRAMLGEVAAGNTPALDDAGQAILKNLKALLDDPGQQPSKGTEQQPKPERKDLRIVQIDMSFPQDIFKTGQDPAFLIADLAEIADILAVKPILSELPELKHLIPDLCYISWRLTIRTERQLSEIEDVFIFVRDSADIKVTDITTVHSHVDELAEKRLGELLIDEGHVREQDVACALQKQRRLGEVLVELGTVPASTVERVLDKQRVARQTRRNTSIRVDTDKLDRLVNLAGELAVTISQAHQLVSGPDATSDSRTAALEALEHIGREMQNQVMAVRMVPIEETFGRFKRLVRDLGQETGKHVVLETFGNETELDKNVNEEIVDPLKHMVRNAIAHGLESPEERIRLGKSDTCRLQLKATQRQGYVVIEVCDDGRGIDPERVYEKARQLGLVGERERYSERQLLDLIFQPGFSTASEVSEISGRGVGLDVVKRNVTNLHGHVEVESQLGRGTTFRIKLPLTLAIIEGMHVRVGPDTMTFPLNSVVELISPESTPIRSVEGKGNLVDVRGEFLPVVRLAEVLGCNSSTDTELDPVVVIVESNERRFGILVDRVIGTEHAVVKSLGKTFGVVRSLDRDYRKHDAVSGATIMGDGDVALILDVPGIERLAFGELQ